MMTEVMAEKINEKVGSNDLLYHLGDFSWGGPGLIRQFRSMINCKNVFLVYGNHDKVLRKDRVLSSELFVSCDDIKVIQPTKKTKIVLCHYSMRVWPSKHHGALHLYGHSHGTLDNTDMSIDVGVDTNEFFPYSLDDVMEKLRIVKLKMSGDVYRVKLEHKRCEQEKSIGGVGCHCIIESSM